MAAMIGLDLTEAENGEPQSDVEMGLSRVWIEGESKGTCGLATSYNKRFRGLYEVTMLVKSCFLGRLELQCVK